jgi:glutamate formiminotransferase
MRAHEGLHPAIGALDVCPVVWLSDADREVAKAEALTVARSIADELAVPTFLYGVLASAPERRERAFYRKGDLAELRRRMASGELRQDFGPDEPHPSAGGTLITARPPLAAFNVTIDSGDLEIVQAIASSMRESEGGLEGVRAIGLVLGYGRGQISMNVHDPIAVPLGVVVDEVRQLAEQHRARPLSAELVGLISQAALRDYPGDVPIEGFDPEHHVIERRVQAD